MQRKTSSETLRTLDEQFYFYQKHKLFQLYSHNLSEFTFLALSTYTYSNVYKKQLISLEKTYSNEEKFRIIFKL